MITRISAILCLALLSSCSQSLPPTSSPGEQASPAVASTVPAATPVSATSPTASSSPAPSAQPEKDYFQEAMTSADRAARMAQGATSKDDWSLVINLYQQTINLLKQVPQNSANYAKAQEKVKEYQANLASAQAKSTRPTNAVAAPQPVAQSAQTSPQAPVAMTAREFLENIYFDQVINQGNSGGALWCASSEILESSFFAPRSYEILSLSEYNAGASATVRLESSNRGGQPIISNWSFYLKKDATTIERDYLNQNSPVSAKAWRDSVGGWCIALINES